MAEAGSRYTEVAKVNLLELASIHRTFLKGGYMQRKKFITCAIVDKAAKVTEKILQVIREGDFQKAKRLTRAHDKLCACWRARY